MFSRVAILFVLFAVAVPAGVAQTPAYPTTPRGVVEAYCRADFDGMQTSSETWPKFVRYAAWPDAPGWDTFTIVAGYTVASAKGSRVRVVYHVLGALEGETARAEPRDVTVDYKLVRKGGRWKVATPQLDPHVSRAVALKILDGLEHNEYVQPDLEKVRASRALVESLPSTAPPPR